MVSKKNAYFGLFIALAFILSYLEFLIPIQTGIPGAKIGLANLVIIVSIYIMGEQKAFLLSVVRILLVAFTFGNLSAMLYSLVGGILSYAAMIVAKRVNLLSIKGVSVLGGIFHNIGQILVSMIILETSQLVYYLPVLLIAGTVSGLLIGILASLVTERLTILLNIS